MSLPYKLPKPGRWYYVTWVDAVASVNDDAAAKGVACVRQFAGRFVTARIHKWRKTKVPYFVFALGQDEGPQIDTGWMTVPATIVIGMEPLTLATMLTAQEERAHG